MVCTSSLGILVNNNDTAFCNVGGDVTISGGEVIFDSNQLTLTCISTGGPATTVTWTRDSNTVTEGTETVLDDPATAQYTHTLTVTTRGEYTCTASSSDPMECASRFCQENPLALYPELCIVQQLVFCKTKSVCCLNY